MHTPGPWTYEPYMAPGLFSIRAKQGPLELQPAEVFGESDARLIAAAPDMLAALQLAEATFRRMGIIGSAYEQMRAAIAKATGGE